MEFPERIYFPNGSEAKDFLNRKHKERWRLLDGCLDDTEYIRGDIVAEMLKKTMPKEEISDAEADLVRFSRLLDYEEGNMKNKIQIANSPLTNTIYAGEILKSGIWAKGKQDVTIDALIAVAEHAKRFGKPIEIIDESGKLLHKITVE